MSKNPYDDYDILNPLGDTSDDNDYSGLDVLGDYEDYASADGMGDTAQKGVGGAASSMPATMVRNRPIVQPRSEARRTQRGADQPILRRNNQRAGNQRDPLEDRYLENYVDGYDDDFGKPAPSWFDKFMERRKQRRQAKRQARRVRGRRRHGFLKAFVILIALAIAAYMLVLGPIDRRLALTPQEAQTTKGALSWSFPGTPYYVLALGSDAQEGTTGERSDTMLLVRIDFFGGKLTIMSIPRDTKVEIEGYGTQKINAAYTFGGVGGAARAVSKLTGVGVNHVAIVHIEELADIVNYLGGVTVNVPEAAYDPDHTGIALDAGMQTLDGETAVAWARTRYGYSRGDFQRQEDQRILLQAIMNRVLSLSPKQMPGALEEMADLVGTDMRCYDFIPLLLRFKLSNPIVYSCSVPSTTETIDGVSYVIADETALRQMMQVINAGGDPGSVAY